LGVNADRAVYRYLHDVRRRRDSDRDRVYSIDDNLRGEMSGLREPLNSERVPDVRVRLDPENTGLQDGSSAFAGTYADSGTSGAVGRNSSDLERAGD